MEAAERLNRKRLHITPFNPTLLDRFVPPSLQPLASGISFHTVETFPERGFGYVELPVMEAEKLKKKINGMTLKGAKVRIEDAKPEKKRKAEVETEEERKVRKKERKEKRKHEEGVLTGHELEEGRRIKRGWTEDASEKKREKKSKKAKTADEGLDGKRLRFRTSKPPNVAPINDKARSKGEDKEDNKDKKARKKTVVQEFAKAKKPSGAAAISEGEKRAVLYEDEKGWMDDDGNVIEAAPVTKRPRKKSLPVVVEPKHPAAVPSEERNEDAETDSDEEVSSVVSSDTPTDTESGSGSDAQSLEPSNAPRKQAPALETQDITASNNAESFAAPEPATEVHPLEVLFKRPAPKPESATKPKPSPIDTSFSFFTSGPTDDAEDDRGEGVAYPPQTPHTREDLEWRSIRSAAPTPDTAAIGKRFDFSFAPDEDEDEEDDVEDGVAASGVQEDVAMGEEAGYTRAGAVNGGKEESAFRKWFYDNRGNLNRGWKKRRRDERKQKRQRDNKRLSRRVA